MSKRAAGSKSSKGKPRLTARRMTIAQTLLLEHLRELGLWNDYRLEHEFCEGRKWRFDIADMTLRIGYEANGGKWSGGHRRGKAIEEENEKLNTATVMGWRVLQFTNQQIESGYAKSWIMNNMGIARKV